MNITKKHDLTKTDFEICSLWRFGEDELYHPVYRENDFPEEVFDLYIKAKIELKSGIIFDGCIIGFGSIYALSIFIGDERYTFNKNILSSCEKKIKEIKEIFNMEISLEDFSPAKYATNFNFLDMENFEGEFNLLKPRTNEERLWQYHVEK